MLVMLLSSTIRRLPDYNCWQTVRFRIINYITEYTTMKKWFLICTIFVQFILQIEDMYHLKKKSPLKQYIISNCILF